MAQELSHLVDIECERMIIQGYENKAIIRIVDLHKGVTVEMASRAVGQWLTKHPVKGSHR